MIDHGRIESLAIAGISIRMDGAPWPYLRAAIISLR
jgi:hypothetical protein